MSDSLFEGTAVLELLAEAGLLDAFSEAVDADDVPRAVTLMKRAGVPAATLRVVVRKMEAGDGEH